MKKNNTAGYIFLCSLVFVLIIISFTICKLVPFEGFNPSDEGVIAAQSFRLMHGEVPHKDFISIRPAGSGYLHIIDFLFPIPFIEAGRWFTIFEYFIYAAIWLFLMITAINNSRLIRDFPVRISACILIAFCLTIQIKHIFPWTTVDAIFFTSIGFLSYFRSIDFSTFRLIKPAAAFWGILLMSIAALCRQTFIFPVGVSGLTILIAGFRSKKLFSALLTGIAGCLPVVSYLIYLNAHAAFNDFIDQMTGRTELFHTGIFEYGVHLFYTPWVILYACYTLVLILLKTNKNGTLKNLLYFDLITFLIIAGSGFAMFFTSTQKTIPFVFFWTTLYLTIRLIFCKKPGKVIFISLAGLLLSWTGSISLGDNSPLFCSGILLTIIASQLFKLYEMPLTHFFKNNDKLFKTSLPVISILILSFTIYSEGQFNYRDLSRNNLTEALNNFFPEMDDVHTNKNTYAYFGELMRLKNELHIPLNDLVVLPNNAAIYPLLNSRNPFPVDWAQCNEYIGAEEKMNADIRSALGHKDIVILVDKIDSKYMFDGFEPFKPDLAFNHAYLPLITNSSLCKKMDVNSPYFDVYIPN